MPRFRLLPLTLAVLSACALADSPPAATVIEADHVDGTSNQETHARGNVVLTRDGETVQADWITLIHPSSEIKAGDHTRLSQHGDVLEGGELELHDDSRIGSLDAPRFSFAPRAGRVIDDFSGETRENRGGHGDAVKLLFEGPDKYRLQDARFTSCRPGDEDWYVKSPDMEIDYTRNLGIARHGTLEFKGVPLLYSPYLDFSLDGSRKSGFLSPTIGTTGSGGFDLTIPWYWNIAPNMDATIAPRLLSKRGVLFDNEFRYLGASYTGRIQAEEIFHDDVLGRERHAFQWQHTQSFSPALQGALNIQSASDDRYFADFGDRVAIASTTYLPREASLVYSLPGFQATARVQRFQTLQDPANPVGIPYERLPQLTLNYAPVLSPLYRLDLNAEAVDFRHPSQLEGQRLSAYPSISLPIERAYGFITPKVGVQLSRYTLSDGRDLHRALPVASLDAGLYFDRETHLLGADMVQSLEPRIYYLHVPFKDQSAFPDFDTSVADFSFAQLFGENRFTGGDRISDANALTTAITSRLFETESGIERARFALGQRFYFDPQRVTLSGPSNTSGASSSDLVATLAGQAGDHWWLDTGWEYDTRQKQSVKESFSLRYQPEAAHLLNLRYRLDRQTDIQQVDVSAEWPLVGGWHGVMRHNWSITDHRALESLAGVEYNGGCWVFRAVTQRYVTSANQTSTAFFIQLELNNLGRLGSNPLQVLKDSIPGYSKLN
jgi:LPS-assembly protein